MTIIEHRNTTLDMFWFCESMTIIKKSEILVGIYMENSFSNKMFLNVFEKQDVG